MEEIKNFIKTCYQVQDHIEEKIGYVINKYFAEKAKLDFMHRITFELYDHKQQIMHYYTIDQVYTMARTGTHPTVKCICSEKYKTDTTICDVTALPLYAQIVLLDYLYDMI